MSNEGKNQIIKRSLQMHLLENKGVTAPKGFLCIGIHSVKKSLQTWPWPLFIQKYLEMQRSLYKNKVKGYPLYITKDHLADKKAPTIMNSGNANTCTGDDVF